LRKIAGFPDRIPGIGHLKLKLWKWVNSTSKPASNPNYKEIMTRCCRQTFGTGAFIVGKENLICVFISIFIILFIRVTQAAAAARRGRERRLGRLVLPTSQPGTQQ
jgi:hypothetical protein